MKIIAAFLAIAFFVAVNAECGGHKSYRTPLSDFGIENIFTKQESSVSLSVSPTLLSTSGEWVTVSISGVFEPNNTDFIAAYSPSNVNISATSPIKYQYANVSSTYLQTGSGSIRFRLVNMHADYAFVFFRNGTSYPIYTATSNTVDFANYQQPLQPHIALTGVPNQMRISWASGSADTQYVKWGTVTGNYSNELQSTTYTYTAEELCGAPATTWGWRDPGNLQTAIVEFDPSEERIYYIFGSDQTTWSNEFSFAPPVPVGPTNGIKFVAYGDMGKAEVDQSLEHWEEIPSINTTRNVDARINEGFQLVLHIGDIAYAVGYSAQWDEFMDQITPVASRVPYMTLPGNHERDYNNSGGIYNVTDSGGECGIPYESRFPMIGTDHLIQWYSFEFGNVHFVMMSTELNFSVGSDQYLWIANDLQNVDRSMTPWVIFAGHRPMYIDSNSTSLPSSDLVVAELLRENLEPLLVKYEVDLAFWGHHHSYQRTCHIANHFCFEGQYPVHTVIGMAGMGLSQNLWPTPPPYMDFVDDGEYGYTTIETNSTHLHMRYYNNANILRDEFYLQH